MKTVHAIFENGVFKPTEPVELPEGVSVTFEPRMEEQRSKAGLEELYELLSERFDSGEHDVAARHNEHQP
jgi:predicted DNA-binding antitoxin AbrB/MazE fold protein